jgi:hypothetical protein
MTSSATLSIPGAETQPWPVLTDAEVDCARPSGWVRRVEVGEFFFGREMWERLVTFSYRRSCKSYRRVSMANSRSQTEAGMMTEQRTLVLARWTRDAKSWSFGPTAFALRGSGSNVAVPPCRSTDGTRSSPAVSRFNDPPWPEGVPDSAHRGSQLSIEIPRSGENRRQ